MTPDAVPHVAVTGFSWTTIMVTLLNLLVGGGLVAWVKTRPKMRELEKTAEEKLRDDLISRVEKLERQGEEERARHEAVVAIMRHRLNNVTQCLDALLMLIEQDPLKAQEAAARVREMRSRQEAAEAAEKTALHIANITAKAEQPPA